MVKFQKQILLVGLGCLLLCLVNQQLGKYQINNLKNDVLPIMGGSTLGSPVWQNNWGDFDEEYTKGLYFNGTDVFVVGTIGSGIWDIELLKYSADGTPQWEKTWGDSTVYEASGLWSDNSSLYTTGLNQSGGFNKILLVKWDMEGNQLWNASFINGTTTSQGIAVWGDGAGSIYTLGKWSNGGNSSEILVKWNAADGSLVWNHTIQMPYRYFSVGVSGNGTHVYTTGYIAGTGNALDLMLFQYDANDGTVLWNRTWGGGGSDSASDIQVAGDTIYTSGTTNSFGMGGNDVFLVKWTLDGEQVWNRTWGTVYSDVSYCLDLTPDNDSIVVGGYTTESSDPDFLILKWNSSGGFQYADKTTGVWSTGYADYVQDICANGTSIFGALYADSYTETYHHQIACARWDNDRAVNDDDAPDFDLKSPSINMPYKSGTLICLNISDPSGLIDTQYYWEGSGWTELAYPYDVVLPAGDGDKYLHISATDSYGNVFNSLSYKFTTDDTGPVIDFVAPCANNSIYRSTTLVNFTIIDDAGIGTVQYYWDAETSNTTQGSPYRVPMPTGDTNHWLHIFANDTLGNLVEKLYNFTMDDTPPTVALKSPFVNNSFYKTGTNIELDIVDLHLIGAVLYHWDSEVTNTTLGGPAYAVALTGTETAHELHVFANDSLGNLVAKNFTFTIDDTAPVINIINLLDSSAVPAGTVINLDFIESGGIAQVQYSWDGGPFVTLANPNDLVMPAQPGQHVLQVRAQDVAGNWGTSPSFTLYAKDDGSLVTNISIGVVIAMVGLLAIHFVQRRRSSRAQKNPEPAK